MNGWDWFEGGGERGQIGPLSRGAREPKHFRFEALILLLLFFSSRFALSAKNDSVELFLLNPLFSRFVRIKGSGARSRFRIGVLVKDKSL